MEGMNIKSPFLARNYRAATKPSPSSIPPNTDSTTNSTSNPTPQDDLTYGYSALEIKICVRTYRMFFVAGTEDCMWRVWASREEKEEAERAHRRRVKKSERWLRMFDEKHSLPDVSLKKGEEER